VGPVDTGARVSQRPVSVAGLTVVALLAVVGAGAQEATHLDSLRRYSTLHSLGFEYDLTGDSDHDATATVRYRVQGTTDWEPALDLMRVDFQGFFASQTADRHYNMLAGSVFFLHPGTAYEVELDVHDPDGGSTRRVVEMRTRDEPVRPDGPVRFVHADSISGDGRRATPLSLSQALASARPGDRFCLLPGDYGQAALDTSGTPKRRIAWLGPRAARAEGLDVPEGAARFQRLQVTASHLWIEGLDFAWDHAWPDSMTHGALKGWDSAADVVVRDNDFRDYVYSIWLSPGSRDWTISDNTIVGRKDIEQEGNAAFSGEGIELQYSEGHTVAYNSISRVADGISYAKRNVDLFGNDIFDTSDDGIEPDYGYANIRMWGNRIANVQYFAFSFQGMHCGPWYILRNQVTAARGALFKFRVMDRVVVAHNTFVAPSFGRDAMHHLLHGTVRNNLFVRDGQQIRGEVFRATPKYRGQSIENRWHNPDLTEPDWRTDWDHNGYDLRGPDGTSAPFDWFGTSYVTVGDFAAAVGIERHGRQVEREDLFEEYATPTNPARRPALVLRLTASSPAIDAGAVLPNVGGHHRGSAPDLGAFEAGQAAPWFGPRPRAQRGTWLAPWVR
jgi:hypothetical protein